MMYQNRRAWKAKDSVAGALDMLQLMMYMNAASSVRLTYDPRSAQPHHPSPQWCP